MKEWKKQFRKRFVVKDESPDYPGAKLNCLVMYNSDGEYWHQEHIESFIEDVLKGKYLT